MAIDEHQGDHDEISEHWVKKSLPLREKNRVRHKKIKNQNSF